ncbi:aminoglycoside phosphotransferase family protein, partial [Escherichia coli]
MFMPPVFPAHWHVSQPVLIADTFSSLVWKVSLPDGTPAGTVAKLAMRQPFVLFKGLTFQKLCLPGAFRPGD